MDSGVGRNDDKLRRHFPLTALALALLLQPPNAANAQRKTGGGTSINIVLPAPALLSRDAPTVVTNNPLAKRDAEDLIRNGFPAHLKYLAELWPASGMVGRAAATTLWEVYVDYEPLQKVFRLVRIPGPGEFQSLGSFATYSEVTAVLSRGYQPRIRAPVNPGRYYYSVTLEVERVTANDLADLRSWLGTTPNPQRNPGKSLVRVITQVFTYLLGAENERHQRRSDVFTIK